MNGFLLCNNFARLELVDFRWFSGNPNTPYKESRWVALYERKKSWSSDEARLKHDRVESIFRNLTRAWPALYKNAVLLNLCREVSPEENPPARVFGSSSKRKKIREKWKICFAF
jgi:hypothetical protein